MVSSTGTPVKSEPKTPSKNADKEVSAETLKILKEDVERAAEAAPFTEGEKWCIISSKWLDQAKKYLQEGGANKSDHPGAIDNSQLIEREDEENYLKEGMTEKADYEFIPETLWDDLVRVFGCEGGEVQKHVIPAITYSNSMEFDCKIEARPLIVECVKYPDVKNVTKIRARRSYTVDHCLSLLLQRLNIDTKDYRAWIFNADGQLDLPLTGPDRPVGKMDLTTKDLVVLELKESDAFALDDATKKAEYVSKLREERGLSPEPEEARNQYNLRSSNRDAGTSLGLFSYNKKNFESTSNRIQGLCGLMNLGNTCFMNSSLQCISNVPELTEFFLSKAYENDLNRENPLGKKGEIADAYANLVREIWSGKSSISPNKFKGTLCRFTSLFMGAQQDSQESLQYIVDCLHEDLNRIRKKPYIEQKEADPKLSPQEAADLAWRDYMARNDSKIVDLFAGQIRSVVKCPDCKKLSNTYDPVFYYSLPLPSTQTKKINYALVTTDGIITSPPRKATVPKTGTIGDLLSKVAETASIPANMLLAADISDKHVQTVFKPDSSVEDLTSRNHIAVFELTHPYDDPDLIHVFLYLRQLREHVPVTSSKANGTLMDYPLILTVPQKGLSARRLYALVYGVLKERFRNMEGYKSDSGSNGDNSENGMDQDNIADQEMLDENEPVDVEMEAEVDQADDIKYHKSFSKYFTLATVNIYGNHTNEVIRPHQRKPVIFSSTTRSNYTFLAVDFKEEFVSNHYKFNNPSQPEQADCSDDADVETLFGSLFLQFSSYTDWKLDKSVESVKLEDCFQLYISAEKLGGNNMWRCPDCKEEKPAQKKLDFWRMPKYMFVHLKRFQYNRFYREKLGTRVKIPTENLDISHLVANENEKPAVYDLVAMSCHSGGLGGGHYWAVCKNKDDGKWYKFDDSTVSPASDHDVDNESNPYILIYRRKDGTNAKTHDNIAAKKEEDMDE